MKLKNKLTLLLSASLIFGLTACGTAKKENDTAEETAASITIAYQYGMAYAPFTVMREQKLIEKYYDGEISVEWVNLNSGSAINEGMASGSVDAAAMGIGPFITGVTAGIPYKMYGTIAAQPHKLMTNQENLTSLSDLTSENKISVVNIGSFQHILLAMWAEAELGDAHALDENLVAMSHPDGMTALLAGSVDCQLTTAPYIYKEAQDESVHEIEGLEEVWPEGNAFIVGLVSDDLYENQPEVYEALVAATKEAQDYLTSSPEEAAALLSETEDETVETLLEWLSDPGCVYDLYLPGVMDMAEFMAEYEFIEEAPASFEAITTESARESSGEAEESSL